MTRLRRVALCWIERPNGRGDYERLRVAEWFLESGQEFELRATREFLSHVAAGAVYSLDIARRFATQPALLDLYLWQIVHQGDKRRELDPYATLPCPQARTKKRQLLRERAALIYQVWPACPFQLSMDGRTLSHVDAIREDKERYLAERAAHAEATPAAPAQPQPPSPFFKSSKPAREQPPSPFFKSSKPARAQPAFPFFKSSKPARPADLSMFLYRPRQDASDSPRKQRPVFERGSTKQPADLDMSPHRGSPSATARPAEPPRSTARPVAKGRKRKP